MADSYLGGNTIIGRGWMGNSSQNFSEYVPHHSAEDIVREVRPPYKGSADAGRRARPKREPRPISRAELLAGWKKAWDLFKERSDFDLDPRGDSRARSAMERLERALPDVIAEKLVDYRIAATDELRAERSPLMRP